MRHCLAKIVIPEETLLDDRRVYCAVLDACHGTGLKVLGTIKHEFHPRGLTAVILLAESHVAVHSYPEDSALYVDVFTCGKMNPEDTVAALTTILGGAMFVSDVRPR